MVYTLLHFVCRGHVGKRACCAAFDLLVVVWRGLLYCATYAWALVVFFYVLYICVHPLLALRGVGRSLELMHSRVR